MTQFAHIPLTGTGIWSAGLRYGDPAEIADAAAELEALGYSAIWIPDPGGPVFEAVERLLIATTSVTIATGVLNLWMHQPQVVASNWARLADRFGNRFLLGIGAGHKSMVDSAIGVGTYRSPIQAAERYLSELDSGSTPVPPARRLLAALGPNMLRVARHHCAGAHTFNVNPHHTAMARSVLGPEPLLAPEQAVAFEGNQKAAREAAQRHVGRYLALPNYVNNFRRMGFTDSDFADGGSSRLRDAVVVGADEAATRIAEHRQAGADHICLQVLAEPTALPREAWRSLAPEVTSVTS